MIDTLRVKRRTGLSEPDGATGNVTPTFDTLYEGKGELTTYEPHEEKPDAGGHQYTVQRYVAKVPAEAVDAQIGDVVEVVACKLDRYLAGRTFRIESLLHKTHATAYRYGVTIEEA